VLEDVRGFVFDVDGTLVHRGSDGRGRPQPGAVRVLEAIHDSGRPLVLFTNGSHIGSEVIARGLREDGLPIGDREVLTPIESATSYLRRYHPGTPAIVFGSDAVIERMESWGIPISREEDAGVVFVAHVDHVDFRELERAARAITLRGAKLLTASYVPGYAGANGMIFSRGAMVSAAIAKVTSTRPKVVGKPSKIAVAELGSRLGVPTSELAVIGDDLAMDVALGKLGGSKTVLVRSGISGQIALDGVPQKRRPDAAVDGVADILEWL
jgi:HAD superfamily hydrolase (TIGR01450 family)